MKEMRLAVWVPAIIGLSAAAGGGKEAQAGGIGLREQGAYYQGATYAGAAAGGAGLASVYWNPAAISFNPGLSVEGNLTYAAPHGSIDILSATAPVTGGSLGNAGVDDIAGNGFLPTFYVSYAWDKWAVGLSATAPYGAATRAPCGWSARYYGCQSSIQDANIQGTVAYKASDWLTLGGGVFGNYINVNLSNAAFAGFASPANNLYAEAAADDIGFGFSVGALFTLYPGTTLGVGYRSSISQNLTGNLNLSVADIIPVSQLPITAALTLPDQVTASLRSQINPEWTVLGTVEWTNWSKLQQIAIQSNGAAVDTLNLQWQDGWFFSFGAEYLWNPNLTVRAGVGYEVTPVTDSARSVRLPDTNRIWLSGGFTYNITQQFSIDFAYSHIFGESATIIQNPTDPTNALRGTLVAKLTGGYVDIFSLGLRYKFDSPAGMRLVTN